MDGAISALGWGTSADPLGWVMATRVGPDAWAAGGTISLTNSNTYAGSTTLNSGTLGIYDNGAISAGALTAAGGATVLFGRNVTYFANNITLNGSVTFDLDNAIDAARQEQKP